MKRLIFAAIAVLALATSCNLDTDQVFIASEYLMAPEYGGTYKTIVYASGAWTAQINAPETLKMSVNPTGGNGQTEITITIEPYTGEDDYALGYIVFECGKAKTSFPVYQVSEEFRKELEEQQQQQNGTVQ